MDTILLPLITRSAYFIIVSLISFMLVRWRLCFCLHHCSTTFPVACSFPSNSFFLKFWNTFLWVLNIVDIVRYQWTIISYFIDARYEGRLFYCVYFFIICFFFLALMKLLPPLFMSLLRLIFFLGGFSPEAL